MVGADRWPSLLPRRRRRRARRRALSNVSFMYEMVSRLIEKRNAADQRCAALLGNNREVTSTWHQSLSPFPDVPALSWRLCRRNFSPSDRSRLLPPFQIPSDLFHDLSPSHPYNPCPTSTCPLPFPPATRHFLPWRSPSTLRSPCCGPSPSELQSFSLRYRSRSSLPHDPSPLPSFRLWPRL